MKKALLALILCLFALPTAAAEKETAYERVMRTGVLRCGYVVWAPYLLKDPNTKSYSGIAYDIMEEVGKELGLKVEWAEETSWGTFHEGLNGNRYDMMCTPFWRSGRRATLALLTRPVYYNGLYAYARADDRRFDHGTEALDKPQTTLAVIDGDATQEVRATRFPHAKELAITDLAGNASILMSVAMRKADVGFGNLDVVKRYNLTADTKLKIVADEKPLRLFGNVLGVKKGEYDLLQAVNTTLAVLNDSSFLAMIAKKYAPETLPVAPDYKLGE